MGAPWNNWYHCIGNTYGTWLPGDPRGFRTRHHREDVPYDYRNPPPPGKYEKRFERAKKLLKRPAVYLDRPQSARAVAEFVRSFEKSGIELLAISIDRVHFHLLARFPDRRPRRWVGLAKKESSHHMKDSGDGPTGGMWGTRSECIPIADRPHQLAAFKYILGHGRKGAATWDFRRDRKENRLNRAATRRKIRPCET